MDTIEVADRPYIMACFTPDVAEGRTSYPLSATEVRNLLAHKDTVVESVGAFRIHLAPHPVDGTRTIIVPATLGGGLAFNHT